MSEGRVSLVTSKYSKEECPCLYKSILFSRRYRSQRHSISSDKGGTVFSKNPGNFLNTSIIELFSVRKEVQSSEHISISLVGTMK